METTARERITHSTIWGLVAIVAIGGVLGIAWRGCEATNKRWQTYVEQGRSEIGQGIWVKIDGHDPVK